MRTVFDKCTSIRRSALTISLRYTSVTLCLQNLFETATGTGPALAGERVTLGTACMRLPRAALDRPKALLKPSQGILTAAQVFPRSAGLFRKEGGVPAPNRLPTGANGPKLRTCPASHSIRSMSAPGK
jgi:hypothetical protein